MYSTCNKSKTCACEDFVTTKPIKAKKYGTY